MDLEEQEGEPAKIPTLIRTYGEFWSPDMVDWGNTWRLFGKKNKGPKSPDLNVYEERGIYVLYKNYVPIYVGKAIRQSIGYRLQLHKESRRKGPRWDSFSWFGLKGFRANGELRLLNKRIPIRSEALIETLEALLIVVIDPRLNARREKLSGATLLYQSQTDRPKEMDQRLTDIEYKLDSLINGSKSK
jgi:hypothetical protein